MAALKSPSKKATTAPAEFDPTRAEARIKYVSRVRPNDPQIKQLQKKLDAYRAKNPAPPPPGQEAQASYDSITQDSNNAMGGIFDQIQNQGAFNPGDFEQQRQGAYDSVMNQFNRSMNPVFDHQNEEFQQRMQAAGVAPGSERYNYEFQQNQAAQNTARQNAEDSAYSAGLNAQQQAWNQASAQYQMPYQNLNSLTPFYNTQAQTGLQNNQQEFQREMAKLQQRYNMQQLKFQAAHRGGGGGGGGGGLTFDQQLQLADRSFYNQLALQGMQMGGNSGVSTGNAAAAGFAQGIGAGIGAGLAR